MKNKFTLADVLAEVREIHPLLINTRLTNVYDVDGEKTFLFRFSGKNGQKYSLLMESGIRFHTTIYARSKPVMPGGFAMKLRKHIRGKRLTDCRQVGGDRVALFTFGSGEAACHVILELYDKGNIILTDCEYNILSLLRHYSVDIPGSSAASNIALVPADAPAPSKPSKKEKASEKAKKGKEGAVPSLSSNTNRVRIAVREKYAFAATAGLIPTAMIGQSSDLSSSLASLTVSSAPSTMPDSSLGVNANSYDVMSMNLGNSVDDHSGTRATDDSHGAVPVIDIRAGSALPLAIAEYLAHFERVIMPSLPAKQRKKIDLISMLTHKGSGVDVYGPILIEHACVRAGAPAGTPVAWLTWLDEEPQNFNASKSKSKDSTQVGVREDTEFSGPLLDELTAHLALRELPYDGARLLRLSSELIRLPSVLESIITGTGVAGEGVRAYAAVEITTPEAAVLSTPPVPQLGGIGAELSEEDRMAAEKKANRDAQLLKTLFDRLGLPAPTVPPLSSTPEADDVDHTRDVQTFLSKVKLPNKELARWEDVDRVQREVFFGASPAAPEAGAGTESASSAAAAGAVQEEEEEIVSHSLPPSPFRILDFSPYPFAQIVGTQSVPARPHFSFPSFDRLCDEFFSQREIERASRQEAVARGAAQRKLARLAEGNASTVAALARAEEAARARAQRVEAHAAEVDAASLVLRSALQHNVGWDDIDLMVRREGGFAPQGTGFPPLLVSGPDGEPREARSAKARASNYPNAVAARICSVDLQARTAVLALEDESEEAARAALWRARMREKLRLTQPDAYDSEDFYEEDYYLGDADISDVEDAEDEEEGAELAASPEAEKGAKEKGGKGKGKQERSKSSKVNKDKSADGDHSAGRFTYMSPSDARLRFGPSCLLITVDISESSQSNARRLYSEAKQQRQKRERAAQAAQEGLSSAAERLEAQQARMLLKQAAGRSITLQRTPFWFERFHWFITTEGLLAVAGRNATDNEALVKRYLRPQDAYLHADVHGAASVVLLHPLDDPRAAAELPMPALSLQQAGAFCLCLSSAWGAGIVAPAWWVPASAVSKTAPTGEYLSTGSFMIRGKKRFLSPSRLEMAVVLLFRVDEACVAAHANDRRIKSSLELDEDRYAVDGTDYGADDDQLVVGAHISLGSSRSRNENTVSKPSVSSTDSAKGGKSGKETSGVSASAVSSGRESSANVKSSKVTQRNQNIQSKKMKKMKKKYGDQDEEDRLEALSKIGNRAAIEKLLSQPKPAARSGESDDDEHVEEEEKVNSEAGNAEEDMQQQEEEPIDEDQVVEPEADEPEDEEEDGPTPLPQGIRTKATSEDEEPSIRPSSGAIVEATADVDVANDVSDEEVERPSVEENAVGVSQTSLLIQSLVATPLPSDVLLHCIPMMCPWSAAAPYKYKLKMVPGGLKKGKAAQAVLSSFQGLVKASLKDLANERGGTVARERDLIRSLVENDVINTVLAGSKISLPGTSGNQTQKRK